MSSTNRGSQRNEADNYPTPAWCVRRLLEAAHLPGGRWLEPAAGDGAIIRAVNEVRRDVEWTAVEIRHDAFLTLERHVDNAHLYDFLGYSPISGRGWDVIITNPPYSLAQAFIERSLELRRPAWRCCCG